MATPHSAASWSTFLVVRLTTWQLRTLPPVGPPFSSSALQHGNSALCRQLVHLSRRPPYNMATPHSAASWSTFLVVRLTTWQLRTLPPVAPPFSEPTKHHV
eukprot:TRINITY_DN26723_c1_g1_i3.p1 TRINITY_DN26723_c1_g1~~TRINITY_DN26723_c1_g1_i3.p1  ORF type:complete len:101 (-),score=7.34 TRINITY_DN26723_c1_g1_i3:167-469(-)